MTPREMTAGDRRFVVPTWAQSSRYDGLSKADRFDLVDRLLDGSARCVVLASDRTVHAWACGDVDTLHYVYVPPELRGHGLARRVITALFGELPEHVHVTHPWPRPSPRFRYVPHLILRSAA